MDITITPFFDQRTCTLTYVVFDNKTNDGIIIDPVLDYEAASSTIFYESVEKVLSFINEKKLKIIYILETHAHADHLSSAYILKEKLKDIYADIKIGIGHSIIHVQKIFKDIYNLQEFIPDGRQFDELLEDEKMIYAGSLSIKTIFTPGHTKACSSYLIGDNLFTGDALFMDDFGTGRCDFPGGSSKELYHSIKEKIYSLPETTKVFTGHDYMPAGREMRYESTVGRNKQNNVHLTEQTSEQEFINFRDKRDLTLQAPKLLLPSIQVNINGGILPPLEDNNCRYLKIPISEKN